MLHGTSVLGLLNKTRASGWGAGKHRKELSFWVIETLQIFKAFLGKKKALRSVLRKCARKVIGRLTVTVAWYEIKATLEAVKVAM